MAKAKKAAEPHVETVEGWGVLIRRDDGSVFLSHGNKGGRAVFYSRRRALNHAEYISAPPSAGGIGFSRRQRKVVRVVVNYEVKG